MTLKTVVYIAYAPLGRESYERFLGAFEMFRPEADLLIVQKGGESAIPGYAKSMTDDSPSDLGTYLRVARASSGVVCFLNSHSEPLVSEWLDFLTDPLASPYVGMVATTGSFEINPHLRTNAFAVRVGDLGSLDLPAEVGRDAALDLEHGPNNIALRFLKRKMMALVASTQGVFMPGRWESAHTFRAGTQEHLLVADNRTRQYAEGSLDARTALRQLAWAPAQGAMR